jgi:RHS repeat-associated protein
LPSAITSADDRITNFAYDGSKARIFEQSDETTKIFAGGLYQRVEERAIPGRFTHTMVVQVGGRSAVEVTFVEDGGQIIDGPTVQALVTDRLGSVVMARTGVGTYIQSHFDEFGQPAGDLSSQMSAGFAGYLHETDLGLITMGARMYDPRVGKMLSPDPILATKLGQDGFNRYAYAGNRPPLLVDPSGLQAELWSPPAWTPETAEVWWAQFQIACSSLQLQYPGAMPTYGDAFTRMGGFSGDYGFNLSAMGPGPAGDPFWIGAMGCRSTPTAL